MDIHNNCKTVDELRCWVDTNNNLIFEKYLPGQNNAPPGDLFSVRRYLPLKEKDAKEILRKSMLNPEVICHIILQLLRNEASICAKSLKTRSVIHLANQSNDDRMQNESFQFNTFDISGLPCLEISKKEKINLDSDYISRNGRTLIDLVDKCPNGPVQSLISTLIMLYNKKSNSNEASLLLHYGDRKYSISSSKALYRYCHKLKNHPDESVRETIDSLLEGWLMTRNNKLKHMIFNTLLGFTGILTKVEAENKDFKDKCVNAVKQCCPALFRYLATGSLREGFERSQELDVSTLQKDDPLTKFISHSQKYYVLDVIDERLNRIWEKYKTNNYWNRQSALLETVWSMYEKINGDKTDLGPDFITKVRAKHKLLVEAFSTKASTQPNRVVKSSAKSEASTPPLVEPSDPVQHEPEVLLQEPVTPSVSPITSYHSRVKRWLTVSDLEKVRSFCDETYAHYSTKELEKQVVDHGFSLAVDDLLKDSSYNVKTDRGLALVAQMIYPNGTVAMGMIHYGIDQGRCFHRQFSEKPLHELLQKSPSLKQQAMSIPSDWTEEQDTDQENVSKDHIRTDKDTGIASIQDGRTGCTINVFKTQS